MTTPASKGFTLLELLVTIGIIGLMGALAAAGYAGAARGMRTRGARQAVSALVDFARRRALVDDAPTVVYLQDRRLEEPSGESRGLVRGRAIAVRIAGRISLISQDGVIADESADWEKGWPREGSSRGGHRIYRFAAAGASSSYVSDRVYPVSRADETLPWTGDDASQFPPAWGFRILDGCADWRVGDAWGEEMGAVELPDGYLFGDRLPDSGAPVEVARIVFDPARLPSGAVAFEDSPPIQLHAISPGDGPPEPVGAKISTGGSP